MDLRPMLAMQDETENICDTALGRTSTKAEADGECEESVVQDAIPTSPFRAAVDASCSPTPPADAADPPNPASNPELYLTFLQQQLDFLRTQFGFQKTPVKESMQLPITTSSPVVVSSPLALRQHVATTVSIGTNTSFIEPRQRVANAVSSSPQITAVAPASASSDNVSLRKSYVCPHC